MDKRPKLTKSISIEDFKGFYWMKEELLAFCKTEKLDKKGGKIEISERIEKYLQTGIREKSKTKTKKKTSKFDWNNEYLTLETIITDNYKNSENVRSFFSEQIGKNFKFNVKFMNWMKSADGKTLKHAVEKWIEISKISKTDKSIKEIAPQFEYNTYIRDFLKNNPTKSRKFAIECWKIKKSLRGSNKYCKTDLDFFTKE